MQFLEKEIQQYTQLVCSTILGIEVHPLPGNYESSPADTFTGSVQITGKWNGALLLCLPSSLVNKLTETIFSLEPGKASLEDRKDAVGELINMIGGNLKALLPEPCTLSVPLLGLEGQNLYFPYTKRVTHCQFECQGTPFALSLYEEIETSK
ncbi:MAG: chemotaxis protein CheX [Nitrospinae bacterium]|nr:chemotaxis protein CheX [Nitrospinota bacterium]